MEQREEMEARMEEMIQQKVAAERQNMEKEQRLRMEHMIQ